MRIFESAATRLKARHREHLLTEEEYDDRKRECEEERESDDYDPFDHHVDFDILARERTSPRVAVELHEILHISELDCRTEGRLWLAMNFVKVMDPIELEYLEEAVRVRRQGDIARRN